MLPRHHVFVAAAAILACASCSKEDVTNALEKAKQAASEQADRVSSQVARASDKAQETLKLAGSAELTLDSPLKTSACYVQIVPPLGGRPAILQIKSYQTPEQESFPSLMLQGNVSESNLAGITGQTVQASMWVQREANGPVWSSSKPVELRIISVENETTQIELAGALHNSENGAEQTVAGKLQAVNF